MRFSRRMFCFRRFRQSAPPHAERHRARAALARRRHPTACRPAGRRQPDGTPGHARPGLPHRRQRHASATRNVAEPRARNSGVRDRPRRRPDGAGVRSRRLREDEVRQLHDARCQRAGH